VERAGRGRTDRGAESVKQLIQDVGTGEILITEVPAPRCGQHQLLVETRMGLISAGTERYVVDLARKSLLGKARERPNHVKRILQKVRDEGLRSTLE